MEFCVRLLVNKSCKVFSDRMENTPIRLYSRCVSALHAKFCEKLHSKNIESHSKTKLNQIPK